MPRCFFVSVGALMDFSLIPLFIIPALVLIAVSIAAKFMTVFLSARMQGINTLTYARSAICLSSSCGELDLVMAKGGGNRRWRRQSTHIANGGNNDDHNHLNFTIYVKIWLENLGEAQAQKVIQLLSFYQIKASVHLK